MKDVNECNEYSKFAFHVAVLALTYFYVLFLVCQYACHVTCIDQVPPVCSIPHSQGKFVSTPSLKHLAVFEYRSELQKWFD